MLVMSRLRQAGTLYRHVVISAHASLDVHESLSVQCSAQAPTVPGKDRDSSAAAHM